MISLPTQSNPDRQSRLDMRVPFTIYDQSQRLDRQDRWWMSSADIWISCYFHTLNLTI